MSEIAPEIYGGAFKNNPRLAQKYAEKMQDCKSENKGNSLGYTYQQLCICWWSSLWYLPSMKQPTLLLRSSDDPLINPTNMQVMNRLIPNSTLHTVHNGGHLFLLTHLNEITPIIEEFLT
ncbi:poly(3-hydroxyalkanoate) depolymerase [compost metagenome]